MRILFKQELPLYINTRFLNMTSTADSTDLLVQLGRSVVRNLPFASSGLYSSCSFWNLDLANLPTSHHSYILYIMTVSSGAS